MREQIHPNLGKNTEAMRRRKVEVDNCRWATRTLGQRLSAGLRSGLCQLGREFGLSGRAGDLQIIDCSWYVTHTGLLRLARRKRCSGIHVEAVNSLCDISTSRYVMKATVFPSKKSSGFISYGDADPSNVSLRVRGAEMRMAETRAVNRALRKAYGVGICSAEEIGSFAGPLPPDPTAMKIPPKALHRVSKTALGTGCATDSARSFASTNSIPSWSSPTP